MKAQTQSPKPPPMFIMIRSSIIIIMVIAGQAAKPRS